MTAICKEIKGRRVKGKREGKRRREEMFKEDSVYTKYTCTA
jgi:hypothetical protein